MHYYRIKFFDQLQLNKKKASCNSCSTNLENIKLSMVMSKQNVKTNNIDDIEETVDLEKFLVEACDTLKSMVCILIWVKQRQAAPPLK